MNLEKLDGSPLVEGKTYSPDHYTQKFEVVIRTLNPIHPETLKNLVQNKYEVIKVTPVDTKGLIA